MDETRYYIRTQIAGRWFCLYNIKYHPNRPIWFDERTLGARLPKLYKTLAIARNTLDTYGSILAPSEVAVWSEHHAHA